MSQVLAGQACFSSPLEVDQKIKYDNIKLISIVVSCPSEIQYLELYSFLVKPLTNLTLILYLFSYMQFSFWLCNFFCLSTDTLARSASSREVSTRQFKFHKETACLLNLCDVSSYFQNFRMFSIIFCPAIKQNCSQVLLSTAILPY